MKIADIDQVRNLMYHLKEQMKKLEALKTSTNIHIQFNDPSLSVTHMNFGLNLNQISKAGYAEYSYNLAYEFAESVLKHQIMLIRADLKTLGITVEE